MPELSEENNNVKLALDHLVDPEEIKPVPDPVLSPSGEQQAPVRNKKVKIDLKTSQIKSSGDQNLKQESGDFVVAEDETVAKPPLHKVGQHFKSRLRPQKRMQKDPISLC